MTYPKVICFIFIAIVTVNMISLYAEPGLNPIITDNDRSLRHLGIEAQVPEKRPNQVLEERPSKVESAEKIPVHNKGEDIEEIPVHNKGEDIEEIPVHNKGEDIEEIPVHNKGEDIEEIPVHNKGEDIEEIPVHDKDEDIEERQSNRWKNTCCAECPINNTECYMYCRRQNCSSSNSCKDEGKHVYAAYCQRTCNSSQVVLQANIIVVPRACKGICAGQVQNLCKNHCREYCGGITVNQCLNAAPTNC